MLLKTDRGLVVNTDFIKFILPVDPDDPTKLKEGEVEDPTFRVVFQLISNELVVYKHTETKQDRDTNLIIVTSKINEHVKLRK